MKKQQWADELHAVHEYMKSRFRPGKPMPNRDVGSYFGMSAEWARKRVVALAKKRLVSRKNGRVVGVK